MKRFAFILSTALFFSCAGNGDNEHDHHDSSAAQTEDQKLSQLVLIMHHMDGDMQNAEITGVPDVDFANLMRIHHQSAVEMADIENAQGKDEEVKSLAAQMKTAQQQEIAQFDSVLAADVKQKASEKFAEEFRASLKGMDHSNYKKESSLDKEFLQLMIPHHQSAIEMAKAYLPYAQNAALKKTAQNIVSSQQQEIDTMKNMQARLK